jgi:hypothetical protein
MNTGLGLRDIQGLDPISWWPLAIGWWIAIGLFFALILSLAIFKFIQLRKHRRWEYQLLTQLDQLDEAITPENSQKTARELAEMMRRIALERYSRQQCANLQGSRWLDWLSEKDPAHYNWSQSSIALIEAPFRQPGFVVESDCLRKTIHAMKGWVK